MNKKLIYPFWKRSFLKDGVEGAEGGSGGGNAQGSEAGASGGDSGEAAGSGAAAGAGAGAGEGAIDYKAQYDAAVKLQQETEQRYQQLMSQVEVDPATGEVKAKELPGKRRKNNDDEDENAQVTIAASDRAVAIQEMNGVLEGQILQAHAGEKLFEKIHLEMKRIIATVPASQRNKDVYEKAWTMARGHVVASPDYEKMIREDERKKYGEELRKQKSGSIPAGGSSGGSSGAGNGGEVDFDSIVLTPQQEAACAQQIRHGLVKSPKEYKENMIYLGLVRR